jgi:hypothetical protein
MLAVLGCMSLASVGLCPDNMEHGIVFSCQSAFVVNQKNPYSMLADPS